MKRGGSRPVLRSGSHLLRSDSSLGRTDWWHYSLGAEACPVCQSCLLCHLPVCPLQSLPHSGYLSQPELNCSFYEPLSEGGAKSQIIQGCWCFEAPTLAHSSRPRRSHALSGLGLENGSIRPLILSYIGVLRLTWGESFWKCSSALNGLHLNMEFRAIPV